MSEVDLNNLSLLEEQVEYDPDAELNPQIMVPDGLHLAELALGSKGIVAKQSNGRTFLKAHVVAAIIAPGEKYDRRRVSFWPTSIVFEGGMSQIHALLKAAGSPAPRTATLGEIKQLLEATLQGKPQEKIRTRWEVSRKLPDGKYDNFIKGMRHFPQNSDGSFNPKVTVDGETYQAQESVTDFQPVSQQQAAA